MRIVFLIFMFVLGGCIGSFLCCQVRRSEQKSRKRLGNRSICLHCKRQLKWYDNIPILSWLVLGGKCRYCGQKIGYAEIIAEILMAVAFVMIGGILDVETMFTKALSIWDFIGYAIWALLFIETIILGYLAIYDGIYGKMPMPYLVISIVIGLLAMALRLAQAQELAYANATATMFFDPAISVLLYGGLYFVLYKVSKGKWVGDGDWLVGTAIALMLFSPWLTLIALFMANAIACIVMLPAFLSKKRQKIYFAPFMVIAFIIVVTFTTFFQNML